MTEPTHLSGEELQWLRACKDTPNRQVTWHDAVVVLLSERLDAARRELAAKTELLANIKALGRVTMATESGRELIMKAITEVLAAPPSEHSEGKQEP